MVLYFIAAGLCLILAVVLWYVGELQSRLFWANLKLERLKREQAEQTHYRQRLALRDSSRVIQLPINGR
jgi:hypothetical protein